MTITKYIIPSGSNDARHSEKINFNMNCENFAGKTMAFQEMMIIRNHKIPRFPVDTWASYIVLE